MAPASNPPKPSVAALFAGVGGIELGFDSAGYKTVFLCENDTAANAVLDERFPGADRHDDVTTLAELPEADVLTAGFPCQDLSQAGRTAGIQGERSGLVQHVFDLLDAATPGPEWVVLENVPFMLRLDRGAAMGYLTREFGRRGYTWAYRVVDTRSLGLPQRRQRVLFVASRERDPRPALFGEDAGPREPTGETASAFGFYWTEGLRGLGWAPDAVPTLKGGSGLGIPSAPAIWFKGSGAVATPDVRDAERLQGLPVDWTLPAVEVAKRSRWKLIGNAVSAPVAEWLGGRLACKTPEFDQQLIEGAEERSGSWPAAAWGREDKAFVVPVSGWPVDTRMIPITDFLSFDAVPLSERATAGFLSRAAKSRLNFSVEFLAALEAHLAGYREALAA